MPPPQSGGNSKLHISCDPLEPFCGLMGGPGCIYNAGGISAIATDKYVSSPDISTIGQTNITLSFWYVANGQSGNDYGSVRLSDDGGLNWFPLLTQYFNPNPNVPVTCTQESIAIPVNYENISNFRIGFRWINNDDATGADPPFSIDDIELSVPSSGPPPVTDFNASITSICEGDCIDFNDLSTNSPTSWEWSFPGASPASSTSQNPTSICYNTAGSYDVTLIAFNANGSDTLEKTQYISAVICLLPSCNFSFTDSNLCEGDCIDFTDLSSGTPTSWEWSFSGASPSTSNLQSPTNICYSSVGTYDVGLIVTNTNGSDTLNEIQKINVSATPTIQVSDDSTIFIGNNIQLSASGGLTYQWSPSTGLDDPTSSSPIASPSQTTTYTITITDQNNCTATDSVKIEVLSLQSLFIPTAFSPNDDNQNDVLYVRGSGIDQLSLKIYDRYGRMIFTTTDISKGWDGSFKGKPLSNNVFTYYLSGLYLSGEIIDQKGTISLVR
ncbi:MAG TPA: PKD domain-containing protein [Bacteroidetes bacterium]|nr:PKD domain-containing protein [Bacteroidota bacterium]